MRMMHARNFNEIHSKTRKLLHVQDCHETAAILAILETVGRRTPNIKCVHEILTKSLETEETRSVSETCMPLHWPFIENCDLDT